MTIEELQKRFIALQRSGAEASANDDMHTLKRDIRTLFQHDRKQVQHWAIRALEDEEKKWFACFVIRNIGGIPSPLFAPLIKAGVYERNPSANRTFIEPCMKHFGARKVNEALLQYLEHGSNFEKAGAVNALYWASISLSFNGLPPRFTSEYATPESRQAYEALSDIWQRKRLLYLTEFVRNEDLDVRRSIIPSLSFQKDLYPTTAHHLLEQAMDIALHHDDDYIAHRARVQLGEEKTLKPLPERKGAA